MDVLVTEEWTVAAVLASYRAGTLAPMAPAAACAGGHHHHGPGQIQVGRSSDPSEPSVSSG